MALEFAVHLRLLELEDQYLVAPLVGHDSAYHFSAAHGRVPGLDGIVIAYKEDLLELDLLADFTCQTLDLQGCAFGYSVLLSATLNDRVQDDRLLAADSYTNLYPVF